MSQDQNEPKNGAAAAFHQLQEELSDTTTRFGRAVIERDRAFETAQRHATNASILQERLDEANRRLGVDNAVPGLGEPFTPPVETA